MIEYLISVWKLETVILHLEIHAIWLILSIDWSQSFHYLLNVVKRNIGSDFLILSDGERRRILKGLIPSLQKSSVLIFYSTQIGCLKLSANC